MKSIGSTGVTEKQKVQRIKQWIEKLNEWEKEDKPTPTQEKCIQAARSYLVVLQENYNVGE